MLSWTWIVLKSEKYFIADSNFYVWELHIYVCVLKGNYWLIFDINLNWVYDSNAY